MIQITAALLPRNLLEWKSFPNRFMTMQFTEQFDVVVVGAGHTGCEVEPFSGRERSGSPLAKS